jgi:hypothetical protein
MKLDATKFGLAWAITFGVFWIICSVLVWMMPSMMMGMSGHMVHGDLSTMHWQLSLAGVLLGLVAWSLLAGITGWLAAVVYNRLL